MTTEEHTTVQLDDHAPKFGVPSQAFREIVKSIYAEIIDTQKSFELRPFGVFKFRNRGESEGHYQEKLYRLPETDDVTLHVPARENNLTAVRTTKFRLSFEDPFAGAQDLHVDLPEDESDPPIVYVFGTFFNGQPFDDIFNEVNNETDLLEIKARTRWDAGNLSRVEYGLKVHPNGTFDEGTQTYIRRENGDFISGTSNWILSLKVDLLDSNGVVHNISSERLPGDRPGGSGLWDQTAWAVLKSHLKSFPQGRTELPSIVVSNNLNAPLTPLP